MVANNDDIYQMLIYKYLNYPLIIPKIYSTLFCEV